jgi:acetyltransferase
MEALHAIFEPKSVALIGASDTAGSLGRLVLDNLDGAGFTGELILVNPSRQAIGDRPVYASVGDAPIVPDVAVIMTPAATVPDIITDCGERGVRGAIVISAGFREAGETGLALEREVVSRSRRYGLRFLGPNCLGVIRADIGFNATFSASQATPGHIAVVSQSGALCTAILDWAQANQVGFSSLISTGISADLGFGEILDYLVADAKTDSIMLYIEGLHEARRFMSALRAAARIKPVVVMKAGRHAQGSRAALSHTGALVGSDDVFDAALRRAGVLRVSDFADFFSAATILDSGLRTRGNRLLIVTNAGGPGVLAADHCAERHVLLAKPSDVTLSTLDAALPPAWSHGNPVDLLGDAPPERYEAALRPLLEDDNTDGVIVILTPQAQSSPLEVAQVVVRIKAATRKPILTCWMGADAVASSRVLFRANNIPTFETPESAVNAFSRLAAYRENQAQLLQVPEPLDREEPPDVRDAARLMEAALSNGREVLSVAESKAALAAFNIPILRSIPAHSARDAAVIAQEIGFPVVVKIDSPDITHKSDVGGVILNLRSADEVSEAYRQATNNARRAKPEAHLEGVVIEPMWEGSLARELMIGVVRDPLFGPIISFGLGGTLVEVLGDRAVALPPLNHVLARALINRTRAGGWLGAFRGAKPVRLEALESLLVHVSEMACELPWIEEMDLNPVIASDAGAVVADARIILKKRKPSARRYDHMAIHPYPADLLKTLVLGDGTRVEIRPIRPEDAVIERSFVNGLSDRSRYLRFMHGVRELPPEMLSRFTQIDYDREMALIAVIEQDGMERQIGVARYASLPEPGVCEFAIVVADDWQGRGLARELLLALIEIARERRFETMRGDVLRQNTRMREFVRSLGFDLFEAPNEPEILQVQLRL